MPKEPARTITEIELFLVAGKDETPIRDRLRRGADAFDVAFDNEALYFRLHEVDIYGNDVSTSGRHFILYGKHHVFTAKQAALVLEANTYFRKNKNSDYSKAEMQLQIKRMKNMPEDTTFIYAGFNHFIRMKKTDIVLNYDGEQIWPVKPPKPRRTRTPKPQ